MNLGDPGEGDEPAWERAFERLRERVRHKPPASAGADTPRAGPPTYGGTPKTVAPWGLETEFYAGGS